MNRSCFAFPPRFCLPSSLYCVPVTAFVLGGLGIPIVSSEGISSELRGSRGIFPPHRKTRPGKRSLLHTLAIERANHHPTRVA